MPSAPDQSTHRLAAVETFVVRWFPLLAFLAIALFSLTLIIVVIVANVRSYLSYSVPPCVDVALPTVRTESLSCGPYSMLEKVNNQLVCTCIHGPHP